MAGNRVVEAELTVVGAHVGVVPRSMWEEDEVERKTVCFYFFKPRIAHFILSYASQEPSSPSAIEKKEQELETLREEVGHLQSNLAKMATDLQEQVRKERHQHAHWAAQAELLEEQNGQLDQENQELQDTIESFEEERHDYEEAMERLDELENPRAFEEGSYHSDSFTREDVEDPIRHDMMNGVY
ncbi:hypothetical protein HDV00_004341 [Rhizophlyctis rosea]|nr:hypothetical protein HDV00_004341 [Rhizophlyctis rosea]